MNNQSGESNAINLLTEDTRVSLHLLEKERDPTFLRAESSRPDVIDLISAREGGSDDEESDDEDAIGLAAPEPGPVTAAVTRLSLRKSLTKTAPKAGPAAVSIQSMDFEETESYTWLMHHTRSFYHDIGHWWTSTRATTAWIWLLVTLTGLLVGAMGVGVHELTNILLNAKINTTFKYFGASSSNRVVAFFVWVSFSVAYGLVACWCCYIEPVAVGSGIPDVKAFLNGVNLNKIVRLRILPFKLIGMSFSVAAGLPLGKEGPMIHAGAITGAAVSQGKSFTFGYDTSWTVRQALRNDEAKRDFVTFGAAAGVAAAFSAPIGGILFTLEEGASFWSTTLTFRAFFCAMMCELAINLLTSANVTTTNQATNNSNSMFPFGDFSQDPGYRTYELLLFVVLGILGGLLGAIFNAMSMRITLFRGKYINAFLWRRVVEVIVYSGGFATILYLLPFIFVTCTPLPPSAASAVSSVTNPFVNKLVQWTCPNGLHNELASLTMVDSNVAMQQLFHMPEGTFGSLSLFAFFVPYFIGGSITNGILLPGGLFVPTLLAGALFGRIFGHGLSAAFPGQVSTPGSYALLGAAAVLGGMSRMTIAGTVIVLEACGNNEYLLPLMLVFAAARYTANAINMPMYDMMIDMKGLPFLERELPTTGMLNCNNVSAIMAKRVVCLKNINRVSDVFDMLCSTKHNGYPVVDDDNRLKGIILRKTLVIILKIKAFSKPIVPGSPESVAAERSWDPARGSKPPTPRGFLELTQCPTIAYDSLEKNYPKYPQIEDVKLEAEDLNAWIDLRSYMDPSPYSLTEAASVQKCYRMFRTMGLRHLIITDSDHRVTGMLTRHDMTEKKLAHEWRHTADDKNYYSSSLRSPAFVPESEVGELESGGRELASSTATGAKSSLTHRAVTGKDK